MDVSPIFENIFFWVLNKWITFITYYTNWDFNSHLSLQKYLIVKMNLHQLTFTSSWTVYFHPYTCIECWKKSGNTCIKVDKTLCFVCRNSRARTDSLTMTTDCLSEIDSQLTSAVPCIVRHFSPLQYFGRVVLSNQISGMCFVWLVFIKTVNSPECGIVAGTVIVFNSVLDVLLRLYKCIKEKHTQYKPNKETKNRQNIT